MRWCCIAADVLMLLMHWCCWCAVADDAHCCWCADTPVLLMHWFFNNNFIIIIYDIFIFRFPFSLSSREFVCWHQEAADSEQKETTAAAQVWTERIFHWKVKVNIPLESESFMGKVKVSWGNWKWKLKKETTAAVVQVWTERIIQLLFQFFVVARIFRIFKLLIRRWDYHWRSRRKLNLSSFFKIELVTKTNHSLKKTPGIIKNENLALDLTNVQQYVWQTFSFW